MKKFLSVLLTFCLMLTVMAVAIPTAAATYTIDFVYADETTESDSIEQGATIAYPALDAKLMGDNVWSESPDEYIPVDTTMPEGNYTVYEYLREGYFGFDNYYDYADKTGIETPHSKAWRLNAENGVMKFVNDTTYSDNIGGLYAADRYNVIALGKVDAGKAVTYKITIAYEYVDSTLPLKYILLTNGEDLYTGGTAGQQPTKTDLAGWYGHENVFSTDDNTVEFTVTTPDTLVDNPVYDGTQKGNNLYLWVGTRDASGTCEVNFDYIKVQALRDITYVYADGTSNTVTNAYYAGDTIEGPAANQLGENYGVWSSSATELIPVTTMPNADITVYEYLEKGVFEFENYYDYSDKTGIQTPASNAWRLNAADGVLKFVNSATTTNYGGLAGSDRYNSIALGKVAAGKAATYKITLEYDYVDSTLPLKYRVYTNGDDLYGNSGGTTNNYPTRKTYYWQDLEIPTDKNVLEIEFTTEADLVDDPAYDGTQLGNNLYLWVGTREAGNCEVNFKRITVEEYKGSVTYNVGENASVNGESVDSTYVVAYYGDDTPAFPEVTYSDGKTVTHWTDDNNSGATVTAPALNGSYTAVAINTYTVTLNKGANDEAIVAKVPEGSSYTLPDTGFVDKNWYKDDNPSDSDNDAAYKAGDVITPTADVTYYSAEAFAVTNPGANPYYANANYGAITYADDAEGFTYLTRSSSAEWAYHSGNRLAVRIGKVENNTTYAITVQYKADAKDQIDFMFGDGTRNNSRNNPRTHQNQGRSYYTIAAGFNNLDGEWKTATIYLTTDLSSIVTDGDVVGRDDKFTVQNQFLYLLVNKGKTSGEASTIQLKEVSLKKLDNVLTTVGASKLVDSAATTAGKQALRYYFDYETEDGTKIKINGNEYDVVERGFIYANGSKDVYCLNVNGTYFATTAHDTKGTLNGVADQSGSYMLTLGAEASNTSTYANLLKKQAVSGDALKNCWKYENGRLTYSTYITGIDSDNFDTKLMVRGYVTFTDGENNYTVYSTTVNRSVNGCLNTH